MKLRTKCAMLCILLPLAALQAEGPTKTVTIEEAVSLAMENNIQLASSAIDVRIKKRAADQAWNVFIPSVQATGTLARTNMSEMTINTFQLLGTTLMPTTYTRELEETERWSAIGGLSVGLNLNLALMEGMKATRQGYEAGLLTYGQARQETELGVRKAFYGILVQQESLKLAKDKLANSEDRVKQTSINYQNGLAPELSVLQTQLAVETQKPAIKEAELTLNKTKKQFAFLLGLPIETEIELSGSIDPAIEEYDADELVRQYLGSGYDVVLLDKSVDMLNAQIGALKYQIYTPSVALSQSWQPTLTAGIDSNWFDTENWSDKSGAFSLTLAFNLTNLLPFSSTNQSLAEAKDNVKKLDLARRMTLYNTELEIRNLVEKLEKSRTSVTAMEMSVSLARKAYTLTEQGYRAGTIEYLDLKDAENSFLQAQLGVLAEKFTYLSTVLDLEKTLNAKLAAKEK